MVFMSAPSEIADMSPRPQLRAGALHLIETVGQSLAAIAPTLTPALNISVVAGLAGLGCWMSYFIGTLGVVIVAASVGMLASRHPEAGIVFRLHRPQLRAARRRARRMVDDQRLHVHRGGGDAVVRHFSGRFPDRTRHQGRHGADDAV